MRKQLLRAVILSLLLPACGGGSAAPGDKAGPGDTVKESPGEYQTGTGKTITIRETHPLGRSLSTIEVGTRDFEHNRPETFADRDPISGVFVADLDRNGFDEIYIITASSGSGSYGDVLGFASNKDRSLSMVNFPRPEEGDGRFRGYMGHDGFAIDGHNLVRTFPVYNEGDGNSSPTGGRRRIVYGLHHGEAMWQLKIESWEDLEE